MTENRSLATTDGKADRAVLDGSMERSGGSLPATFIPTDFSGVMEVAKLMSGSRNAVPNHLRGNPGACLAVALDAYHLGVSPFALARTSYVVNENATISYEGKAVAAMVNARAGLEGRLRFRFEGEGEALRCTVYGTFRGDKEPCELTVEIKTISTRNSPLWKQQPRVQLGYWAIRAWARLYCPEVILGFHAPEEQEPAMVDVTHAGLGSAPTSGGDGKVVTMPAKPTRAAVARMAKDGPPVNQGVESPKMRDAGPIIDQTEADLQDAAAEADRRPAADPEPETFTLVDVYGEVVADLDAQAWVERFVVDLNACDGARGTALLEHNADAIEALRDRGFDTAASIVGKAITAWNAGIEAANTLLGPEPPEDEPAAGAFTADDPSAYTLALPQAADGGTDWLAFDGLIHSLLDQCRTPADFALVEQANADHLRGMKIVAKTRHAKVLDRIKTGRGA